MVFCHVPCTEFTSQVKVSISKKITETEEFLEVGSAGRRIIKNGSSRHSFVFFFTFCNQTAVKQNELRVNTYAEIAEEKL
jgi:hypothetical protein